MATERIVRRTKRKKGEARHGRPYDPMKDPEPHAAPEKSLVDKVIEMALGAGGRTVTLLSGLLAAVLILYSGYVLYDTFATERAASSNAWDLLQYKPEILEDSETPLSRGCAVRNQ